MKGHISEERIFAWMDGQLDSRAAQRIEQHLVGCGICRALQEESSAVTRLFREMEPVEQPPFLWSRIASRLAASSQAPSGWFTRLPSPVGRPAWLRAEVLALAAALMIACSVGVMHWSTVRYERRQLAEIDRVYHALLPQSAETYNPFSSTAWNNTEMNPFTRGKLSGSSHSSRAPLVKR